MDILIKGMEMPKGADQIWIDVWGSQGLLANKIVSVEDIVEIPTPHGRLIDGDELKEKRETMCWKDEYYMTHESDFVDTRHIDNAPTIVEAEE